MKDRFSKKIQYPSTISWRQTLMSTSSPIGISNPGLCHEISSSTCPGLPWTLAYVAKLNDGELGLSIKVLDTKNEHKVLVDSRIWRTPWGINQHRGQKGPIYSRNRTICSLVSRFSGITFLELWHFLSQCIRLRSYFDEIRWLPIWRV